MKGHNKKGKQPAHTQFEKAARSAKLVPEAGKGAVEGKYRDCIEIQTDKSRFTGSIDIDAAMNKLEPGATRWDYGLGLLEPGHPERAVWVEPHPAGSTREVKVVLAKLDWLEGKLRSAPFAKLRALTQQTRLRDKRPFHWLATGHVSIRPGSREANMLAVKGLSLPSAHLKL